MTTFNLNRGVGVKMSILVGNYYIPSMDQLERSSFFLQNLPSIICARVLDPQPNELILDMCCAPGGKTTHIAELVNNKVTFLNMANSKKNWTLFWKIKILKRVV